LVGSSQNLVLIFAFGCPTGLPNFSPIEACVSELEQFLCLCEKKKKTETLVSRISEMPGAIYFNFGIQPPLIGGHFYSKFGDRSRIYECGRIATLLFLLIYSLPFARTPFSWAARHTTVCLDTLNHNITTSHHYNWMFLELKEIGFGVYSPCFDFWEQICIRSVESVVLAVSCCLSHYHTVGSKQAEQVPGGTYTQETWLLPQVVQLLCVISTISQCSSMVITLFSAYSVVWSYWLEWNDVSMYVSSASVSVTKELSNDVTRGSLCKGGASKKLHCVPTLVTLLLSVLLLKRTPWLHAGITRQFCTFVFPLDTHHKHCMTKTF